MDVRTQDAIERLMRKGEAAELFDYINSRRAEYQSALTSYDPTDVVSMARAQGMVMALDEVLRIPLDAKDLKGKRT